MTDSLITRVLEIFKFNEDQRLAALERGRDVVVTAGAGSGKTSTLVGRYLSLLAEGTPPRRIAAITFTKKAAREMRSRVRVKLMELQQKATVEEERQMWSDLSAQMDSARIGTIHSLCTEILRAHPAEAGIDPRFEVLDEGLSAALRIQAVDDTLKGLVEEERFLPLLMNISLTSLNEMLKELLNKRLEAMETFAVTIDNRARLIHELKERMNDPLLGGVIADLRGMTDGELVADAGDTLAGMVRELLALWADAEKALAEGDLAKCTTFLFQARREKMKGTAGKKDSSVKEMIAGLHASYDDLLDPLIGGKNASDPPPSLDAEALFEKLLPLLREAFDKVHQAYKDLVETYQALDFDDLEYLAQQLLRREDIRARWQAELDAVLVDEFQDTNQRQREIVEALAGPAGRLFIVGDMRQSIYRFRRADVTVFRDVQDHIRHEGGLLVDLKKTYRAHEPLLLATGDLLSEAIGTEPDPLRKYYIPYTPLIANDPKPPDHIASPHVELVFGVGEDTETARPLAARALVDRLLQFKEDNQIKNWDDVALLFRASTGFPVYEEALEEAGIPFVTVAGRGFYDRPEIRDLINILRALSDPMDDLAFAGLLRSPAFGLSDSALFLLRQSGQPFRDALQGDLSMLDESDRLNAERTKQILTSLLPLVDRVPVAELLKQVVDAVDYRAVLATADLKTGEEDASASGGRLWRNLDKLLEDAQVNQQISVRDFLNLIKTLNDAGAREGEAPAEAEGAVRLMTIHKAKGLEYPIVVLADISRDVRSSSEQAYLSDDLGVTFKLDPAPMLYRLARHLDKDQNDAEALRLLYVAMTRAKAKLLISGHGIQNEKGEIKLRAWADKLLEAAGLPPEIFSEAVGTLLEKQNRFDRTLGVSCLFTDTPAIKRERIESAPEAIADEGLPPLYSPITVEREPEKELEAPFEPRLWRASQPDDHVPGDVLGSMVHKALQHWLFPGDPRLESLLKAEAFNAGLASEKQRATVVQQATALLERLRKHPIWEEIDAAQERHSELPYTYQVEGRTENRFIDLLYRSGDQWRIVDFKTDAIQSPAQKEELLNAYIPQVQRYRGAVKALLGVDAAASICFLDDRGDVGVAII